MGRTQNIAVATLPPAEPPRAVSVRRFDEVDWDFPDQFSESPFSKLHWHPCRFPSQIPAIVIGRFTMAGEAVLDPFLGSGTTLVEAQRLGRSSTGIDINPVACLLARAKTLPCESDEVVSYLELVKTRLFTRWDDVPPRRAPPSVQKEKWYTPATQVALEKIWAHIHSNEGPMNLLLRAAFSSILLSACREDRHWGYVCDNTAPKADRERDVRDLYCEALDHFSQAYRARAKRQMGLLGRAEILQGDAASVLEGLPSNSFSCFVTSPPYFGVADYVKSQRLSMEWFEIEIEPSRQLEIGARSKRHRKSGAKDYCCELRAVFAQTFRVLKSGGWGVVLYGHSPTRSTGIDSFVDDLHSIGFTIELKKRRQIREMRRQFPSLKNEIVLLVRKP